MARKIITFFPSGATAPSGQGLLIVEASRLHSGTPQSVELLRTSDQPVAAPLPDYTQHSQEIDMTPAGFEPTILASERP